MLVRKLMRSWVLHVNNAIKKNKMDGKLYFQYDYR